MRKTGGYIAGGVGSLMHSLHPLFNHQMARYYLGPPLLFFQPPSLHYLGVHHFPHASPLGDWLLQLFTNNHGRIIWSHSFCHGWKTKLLIAWKLSCFYACHLVPLKTCFFCLFLSICLWLVSLWGGLGWKGPPQKEKSLKETSHRMVGPHGKTVPQWIPWTVRSASCTEACGAVSQSRKDTDTSVEDSKPRAAMATLIQTLFRHRGV